MSRNRPVCGDDRAGGPPRNGHQALACRQPTARVSAAPFLFPVTLETPSRKERFPQGAARTSCVTNRAALMLRYRAGLRISAAVAAGDIDLQRMLRRIKPRVIEGTRRASRWR
jgi:hypothetical protein